MKKTTFKTEKEIIDFFKGPQVNWPEVLTKFVNLMETLGYEYEHDADDTGYQENSIIFRQEGYGQLLPPFIMTLSIKGTKIHGFCIETGETKNYEAETFVIHSEETAYNIYRDFKHKLELALLA